MGPIDCVDNAITIKPRLTLSAIGPSLKGIDNVDYSLFFIKGGHDVGFIRHSSPCSFTAQILDIWVVIEDGKETSRLRKNCIKLLFFLTSLHIFTFRYGKIKVDNLY